MRPSTFAGIALVVASGAALAQRPVTLPGRSQSPGQQSIDNAACYAYANQQTKVVMARESQVAPRDQGQEAPRPLTPPRPVAPPLPPSVAASGASGASAASAASAATAAQAASGASAPLGASAAAAPPGTASGAYSASAAAAASSASDAIMSGDMKMPPLPPPEPPMVRYWRAFGECMQDKGYFVR